MRSTRFTTATFTLTAMIAGTLAHADTMVYYEDDGGGGNPRGLYDFDTETGGSTLRAAIAAGPQLLTLARRSDGTVFFMDGASLYTVDLDDGTATLIGPTGLDTVANITFDTVTGVLYGLARHGNFYVIDPSDASSTFVGSAVPVRAGLVSGPGGILYGFASNSNDLCVIDPSDASVTVIGGSGVPAGTIEGADFSRGGDLIVTDWEGHLYDVDPGTGARTLLAETGMEQGLFGIVSSADAACAEDVDGSGAVDFGDILAILAAWGSAGGPEDLDGSGTVDFGDILLVLAAWGGCA